MIQQKIHGNQKKLISTDMYLKTIYEYEKDHNLKSKPVHLSKILNISKSSVSEMITKLEDEKYLSYKSYGKITLTKKGIKRAKSVSKKFGIIKKFLIEKLGVKPNKADIEACNLEHAFSNSTVKKLQNI
ncbi:metal-dependent transcriptional regulator [archaeon]|jgi:DtxR family transcriptional regulator, Mn-dependent transcriptional regulator|nr:metal-dependent transcriptional regulator [archaeon]MBT4022742.1 metal-dependent transcriptional regulator [archaeon]MBT4273064.1 metal-dependent transcriptional regulator [archaeon]MBT4461045.1 metal-dependent transcriptional regulator [archaeon]MBT4858061.1 metal-dependent transcriptional regulator [archaeon]